MDEMRSRQMKVATVGLAALGVDPNGLDLPYCPKCGHRLSARGRCFPCEEHRHTGMGTTPARPTREALQRAKALGRQAGKRGR